MDDTCQFSYPNGRILRYEYNTGVDASISRVSFLADDSSGSVGTHLEEYSYLGLGTIVQRNRPEPGTKLTYINQSSGIGDAGDQYTGLDRFGRVIDQNWVKSGTSIDEFKCGYDANSNVTYRDVLGSGNGGSMDEAYAYDGLNRLTKMDRGSLSGSTITSPTASQVWTLDQVGNSQKLDTSDTWTSSVTSDTPGTAQTTTTGWYGEKITVGSKDLMITQLGRTFVTGNSGTHTVKIVDADTGTDVAGASVTISTSGGTSGVMQYATLDQPVVLTHGHSYYILSQETSSADQWYDNTSTVSTSSDLTVNGSASYVSSTWTVGGTANRSWGPVAIKYTYAKVYNSQNEMTAMSGSTVVYDSNGNQTTDETGNTYVYDAWNRLYSYTHSGSTKTYSYDALGRRITETASGSTTHLYYSANWQVLEERLDSSSNAHAQYVWGLGYVNDLVLRDRDADSNSGTGSLGKSSSGLEERLYAQQDANYNVTSLTNTSGTVVEQYQYDPYGKVTYMDGTWGGIGASAKAWQYLFQGGRLDSTTGDVYFEHRDYDVDQGRWKEADPLGYPDGGNRYEFTESLPVSLRDPMGTDDWANTPYFFGQRPFPDPPAAPPPPAAAPAPPAPPSWSLKVKVVGCHPRLRPKVIAAANASFNTMKATRTAIANAIRTHDDKTLVLIAHYFDPTSATITTTRTSGGQLPNAKYVTLAIRVLAIYDDLIDEMDDDAPTTFVCDQAIGRTSIAETETEDSPLHIDNKTILLGPHFVRESARAKAKTIIHELSHGVRQTNDNDGGTGPSAYIWSHSSNGAPLYTDPATNGLVPINDRLNHADTIADFADHFYTP